MKKVFFAILIIMVGYFTVSANNSMFMSEEQIKYRELQSDLVQEVIAFTRFLEYEANEEGISSEKQDVLDEAADELQYMLENTKGINSLQKLDTLTLEYLLFKNRFFNKYHKLNERLSENGKTFNKGK